MFVVGFTIVPLAIAEEQEDRELRERLSYFYSEIVDLTPPEQAAGTDPRPGIEEKVMKVYNAWGGAATDRIPPNVMVAMYDAAGGGSKAFKVVAKLIDEGMDPSLIRDADAFEGKSTQIGDTHSVQMAEMRDQWIEAVIEKVATKEGRTWEIARSDSGNVTSGMKSDLDQTFYVFEVDENGVRKRKPDLDKLFIAEFEATWKADYPDISLDALDIASIEGKNRFPDPRDMKTNFADEFRRTTMELRRTPGAYTFQGAVVAQMQFRALQAVLDGNTRAYQVYGPDAEGNWTKMDLDPDAAIHTMFGIEPKLLPAHAFGASLANYLELLHYMDADKFESKYHLRTAEDAMLPLWMKEKLREGKIEFTDLDATERSAFTHVITEKLFTDPRQRRMHEIALNISTDLRLVHKKKPERIPAFAQGVPDDPKVREAAIFSELAGEMFDDFDPANPDPDQVKAAVREHRKLAAEFCLESVYHSSIEAYKVLSDSRYRQPFDIDGYRHLMSGVDPDNWGDVQKRLRAGAEVTFLYGIYDLNFWQSVELMRRLHGQLSYGDFGARFQLIALWTRGRLQFLEEAWIDPERAKKEWKQAFGDYVERTDAYMRTQAAVLSDRVQQHVLTEFGFERVQDISKVHLRLGQHGLKWNGRKLARQMALDPGNIDAFAQILRTFVETKGDWDATLAVTVNEVIMAVPVAGQIYSASQSDFKGLVLMGGACYFPAVGVGLMAYSVGEAGYAIYDMEYRRHQMSNIESAIYRGFAGPAVRVYEAPPQYTEHDETIRGILGNRLAFLPQAIAAAQGERRAQLESDLQNVKNAIGVLDNKKAQWESFAEDSAYGGYFTGGGGIEQQQPFSHYLLADFPMVIGYSPAGIIDFRADYDPATDAKRLDELQQLIPQAQNAEALLRLSAELTELDLQQSRWERAVRYRRCALGEAADKDNMTEIEAASGSRELAHKLRRDSVYPGMIELALAQRQTAGGDMSIAPNTDRFVDAWFEQHGEACTRELVGLGLLHDRRSEFMTTVTPATIPAEVIENLKSRLESDYQRSRRMYQQFQEQEDRRRAAEAVRQQNREAQYHAQAVGKLVEDLNTGEGSEEMHELMTAMRMAAIKRNPPRVEATVYMTRRPEDEKDDEAENEANTVKAGEQEGDDQKIDFRVNVRVTADPMLYQPPYNAQVVVLDKAAARQAVQTGFVGGVAIQPEVREALQIVVEQKLRDVQDDDAVIPLVTVFASKMPDLSRAIPETVEHLPGVTLDKSSSSGAAMPGGVHIASSAVQFVTAATLAARGDEGYLMGQSIAYGRARPERAGDLVAETRRGLRDRHTHVVVTSKALAEVTSELQGRSLEMALYAAFDPDDEFVEVMRTHRQFGPNTVPEPLPETEREWVLNFRRPKRIADDQAIFPNAEVAAQKLNELAEARGDKPRDRPLYFIVGQRWVTWSTAGTEGVPGPETRSPPSELGPIEIHIDGNEMQDDGTILVRPTSDKTAFGVLLRLRDQDYEYGEVSVTVTSGGWTGNFWNSQYKGANAYFPTNPGGGSVSITAHRPDGISAEATFTLTADPDDANNFNIRLTNANDSASEKLKKALEQAERRTEGANENVGYLPGRIKELQEEYQRTQSKRTVDDLAKLMKDLVFYQYQLLLVPQVQIPRANAEFAITVAKAQKNWRMVVSRNRTMLALLELEFQLEEQRLAALTQISEWARQAKGEEPDPPREQRGPTDEQRRRIKLLDDMTEFYGAINRYAPLAGDAEALRDAVLKWNDAEIEMARLRGDEKKIRDATRSAGGRLQSLGEHIACLAGDRDAGAALWIQGYEMRKPTEPTTDMLGTAVPVRNWQDLELPWWFPESKRQPAREDE
jgi:hypothetical protein